MCEVPNKKVKRQMHIGCRDTTVGYTVPQMQGLGTLCNIQWGMSGLNRATFIPWHCRKWSSETSPVFEVEELKKIILLGNASQSRNA